MKERPILFSGPMVRAILDGRKTQTRRIVKPQPEVMYEYKDRPEILEFLHPVTSGTYSRESFAESCCKFGVVGDRLWVRETFASISQPRIAYKADGFAGAITDDGDGNKLVLHHGHILEAPGYPFGLKTITTIGLKLYGGRWKPSIHMPRWASRITLEITGVRVERLQDISEDDAIAEGVEGGCLTCGENCMKTGGCGYCNPEYRDSFIGLWHQINGPDSWDSNPWVWAVAFKRVTQ